MENVNPHFSIIFVNYKSCSHLEAALKSFFSNESPDFFEIIVINNDKRESERLSVLQKTYPFILRENSENIGFGSAVNQGMVLAKAPWVGLLNPDILWPNTQLENLLQYIPAKERIIGLPLYDKNGKREQHGSGKRVTLMRLFLNHVRREKHGEKSEENVDWISGGAIFFSKATWEKLGGFDEKYFLYYEDVDFCERARQMNIPCVVLNQFRVIHFRGQSQESKEIQKKLYRNSQKYYFSKFRPWHEQKILTIYHFLAKILW
jgi:N-acetylglucosaminyl-diphospho-decaprenol L-rhamnosyltransferase